jgi:hypothetical protein
MTEYGGGGEILTLVYIAGSLKEANLFTLK